MHPSPPPDEDWNEATGPIDGKAVQVLLDNHSAFKGFLRRHLPSEEVAEDLLQQSLLKSIRSPEGFSGKENTVAWFYRILRNTLTDYYRARAAEGRKFDGFLNDLVATGNDSLPGPDSEVMREICACMGRLIPTLKPEYAELVRKVDLGGEEPAALADAAGITYNNLMVRLHRARQALKKSLERSCGSCTKHGCLDCTCGHGGGHAHGKHSHH